MTVKSFLTKLILRSAWRTGAQVLQSPFLMLSAVVLSATAGSVSPMQAAELSEIRDRGYLTVGVKDNRAPLGFLDDEGTLTGFEIEIAQRLAEELLGTSTALRLVPVTNVGRLNAVIADDVDIAIAALTVTAARRRIVNFSDPYYLDGAAFITRRANLQALRDLSRSNIALLDGSSTVPRVRYILPSARLFGVSSYREGQAALADGLVDAFAGDASVLASWAVDEPEYRILPSIVSAEPLAIAIPKGTRFNPLKAEINQALRRWYDEGWLQARAAHWGLPSEASQFIDLSPEAPLDAVPEAEGAGLDGAESNR